MGVLPTLFAISRPDYRLLAINIPCHVTRGRVQVPQETLAVYRECGYLVISLLETLTRLPSIFNFNIFSVARTPITFLIQNCKYLLYALG